MGKIRVKHLGSVEEEKAERERRRREREEKKKRIEAAVAELEPAKEEKTAEKPAQTEEVKTETDKETKPTKKAEESEKKKKSHSAVYQSAKKKIDSKKLYAFKDALKLLKEITSTKFPSSVELHINTNETGLRGQITLPHGTGKKRRVAVASDEIISNIKNGLINFDILVAHPSMMPKLATVAKVLGPRGLMPNPKAGTISDKPEALAKELEGGKVEFKTESKFPIIHTIIGKIDFTDEQLTENYQTLITAIKVNNIKSISLKSTMSPAIWVEVK